MKKSAEGASFWLVWLYSLHFLEESAGLTAKEGLGIMIEKSGKKSSVWEWAKLAGDWAVTEKGSWAGKWQDLQIGGKKAGGMCEKAMQAAATVYLLVAACMVPLYMHDGYYGLGTAKFQLYRNVGFMALPLMVNFCCGKSGGRLMKGTPEALGQGKRREWDAAGHLD